ncbi:MAG: aspartate kinase [Phycisphaeraceae bacterium]|nr:aspartate kinase [Phycisphaeraceae bacterium]
MGLTVCKFGGTSLADEPQIRKVQAIVAADAGRRFVVPSAPGRRNADDRKITDLLYLCHNLAEQKVAFDEVFDLVSGRYRDIASALGVDVDLDTHLAKVRQGLLDGASADYAASRGEFLNGLIIARLLDSTFVDAAEIIFFDAHGAFETERTQQAIDAQVRPMARAVVPGFYGSMPDGSIKTFSRGGSDITGAIVARGVGADVYENWTDVSGLLMADPRIVDHPKPIDVISYRELRELSYMGATVLHEDAIFPVRQAGIPVNIRNTNRPEDAGSMIVPEAEQKHTGAITGIAGRKHFTVIALEKALMNAEIGFGRRLLNVLESNHVSFEHIPSGIDTMSVVIADQELDGKLERIKAEIDQECRPNNIDIYPEMALIATVGRGMARQPGMAAKLFAALADAKVNIRMIDQGSSEINIIVGVETEDFEKAVCAIYKAFIG